MFSVIVPTMWYSPALSMMLPKLVDSAGVGEIILINNESSRTPALPNSPKLVIKDFGKNIYVNPAWNFGCENAKHDKFCILSDDVLFNPILFNQIGPLITPDGGMFGLHSSCWKGREGHIREDSILKPIPTGRNNTPPKDWGAYGMLMFLHKEGFDHIPDQLAIFAGDTWLYAHNNKIRNKQNYYIQGIDVVGTARTTSNDPKFKSRGEQDKVGALELFRNRFGSNFSFMPS